MDSDINNIYSSKNDAKQIRTYDEVNTLEADDVVFSLISGKAAIVGSEHKNFLFTQNYVKLLPTPKINAKYLVYLLNEDADIRRQLYLTQQGSATLKFTINQLSKLKISKLPPEEIQKVIGELYFNQLKLESLKKHQATLTTTLVLEKIKKAIDNE